MIAHHTRAWSTARDLRRSGRCIKGGPCLVRSAQSGACTTRGSLISEPDRPLADHAAFSNQCVVKKKRRGASVALCLVTTSARLGRWFVRRPQKREKKIFDDRLDPIGWQIYSWSVQCSSNFEPFGVLLLHVWFQHSNTYYECTVLIMASQTHLEHHHRRSPFLSIWGSSILVGIEKILSNRMFSLCLCNNPSPSIWLQLRLKLFTNPRRMIMDQSNVKM